MRKSLKKFDNICNTLLNEQIDITATFNGKDIPVKQQGDKTTIECEIPPVKEQVEMTTLDDVQNQTAEQLTTKSLDQVKNQLSIKLQQAIETSRSAKLYANHATDDKPKVMFNYGYAEGQKTIIKYILKKLNALNNQVQL